MITYDKFFALLEKSGISQNDLVRKKVVTWSTINRMRHNQPIKTDTIDALCKYLHCGIMDILEYYE